MSLTRLLRTSWVRPAAAAALAGGLFALTPLVARQNTPPTYVVIAADGRHALPFHTTSAADLAALDQLAALFGFTVREDTLAGGLTITTSRQTIILTPNQAYASIAGRLVSMSAPLVREGRTWYVPIDFLSRVLGPALGQTIEVRRSSHLVVAGDVRVPQLTGRMDRQGATGRLTVDIQPLTTYRTSREPGRLVFTFDAAALDLQPTPSVPNDLIASVHADGMSLIVDLGSAATLVQTTEDSSGARVTIDLNTSAPAPPPSVRAPQDTPPQPVAPIQMGGGIRTVAIDPGHGGADAGVRGGNGALEKDLTLAVARRLKAAIEERLGLRVILTREGDDNVPVDRRAALANNNKADLFISLHVNASMRAEARGAEVLSLSLDDYRAQQGGGWDSGVALPVVSGGTRKIAAIPWELAQIPYAAQSATLAVIVDRQLRDHQVPMHEGAIPQAPLRVLVGANMPAVLVEMGFLSNRDDAAALAGGDLAGAIVEGLLAVITEARNGISNGGRP